MEREQTQSDKIKRTTISDTCEICHRKLPSGKGYIYNDPSREEWIICCADCYRTI